MVILYQQSKVVTNSICHTYHSQKYFLPCDFSKCYKAKEEKQKVKSKSLSTSRAMLEHIFNDQK